MGDFQEQSTSFFREATLSITGSLEIEKSMFQCLYVFSKYMPAELLVFHLYDGNNGILETIAMASPLGSKAFSHFTPVTREMAQRIEEVWPIRVWMVDNVAEDIVSGPISQDLAQTDVVHTLTGGLSPENGSAMVMDLTLEEEVVGIVTVMSSSQPFTMFHARLLAILNEPFAIALSNYQRFRELEHVRDLLEDDNRFLHRQLRESQRGGIVGANSGLGKVMDLVRHVAPLDSPVLLLGETGVGKEVIANAIFNLSPRKDYPFIKVNCGAIPQSLIDSELFGHEKGAFTGALAAKRGRFERADKGVIFLDEIGELPPEAQVRLLRVLQEGEIDRVGGQSPVKVDIRVIAATHRDLSSMVESGDLRKDLFFRINVFPITIPPLRERAQDIPLLVHHFMEKISRNMKKSPVPALAPGAMDRLLAYHWPGNVRELENVVERALILNQGAPLAFDLGEQMQPSAQQDLHPASSQDLRLDVVMADHIRSVLAMAKGRVEGEKGAARLLDIHPSTLRKRMRKLGIPFGRKTF